MDMFLTTFIITGTKEKDLRGLDSEALDGIV